MNSRDRVVVIGSGASGLASAIWLARLGYGVTLLERNGSPGGVMRSYSRRGIDLPVGIHYLGLLGKSQLLHRIFSALDIERHISLSRLGEQGPIEVLHTPRGRFELPAGIDAFADALHRAFPADAAHIPGIIQRLLGAAGFLDCLAPGGRPVGQYNLLDNLGSISGRAAKEGWSLALQEVLAMATAWVGVQWTECPEYLHATALSSYLVSAWRLDEGGAHLADTMANRLESLGATIRTSEPAVQIVVADGKVVGVQTGDDAFLEASAVISTLHPATTLGMLEARAIRSAYRSRVLDFEDTQGCFALHALVDGTVQPPRNHNVLVGDAPLQGGIRFFQLCPTTHPALTLLSAIEPDEPGRWEAWAESTTGQRGPAYREAKEVAALTLLNRAAEALGPLGTGQILDAYTPLTLRDWTGSPTGSIYGISRKVSQQMRLAGLRRSPVQGLHLAGQSVTAPGIIGAMLSACQAVERVAGAEALARLFV